MADCAAADCAALTAVLTLLVIAIVLALALALSSRPRGARGKGSFLSGAEPAPPKSYCVDQACVECRADADCGGDEHCENGTCWPQGIYAASCSGGAECPSGLTCQLDGYCHPADSCFSWKPLDFSQSDPPSDMFKGNRAQQPYSWPMVARNAGGSWYVGFGNQNVPSQNWGATSGTDSTASEPATAEKYGDPAALESVYSPGQAGKEALYLAVSDRCAGDATKAATPESAVTLGGRPVCYDFSSWAAGSEGSLSPYLADIGSCGHLWSVDYLGEPDALGNDYALLSNQMTS